MFEDKQRIVQEFVPGKQITLAHIIANPERDMYRKLGLADMVGAVGIMTITPSEGAIIAADVASKAADVKIGFIDRFSGSLLIVGDVAAVEASIIEILHLLCGTLKFTSTEITKS